MIDTKWIFCGVRDRRIWTRRSIWWVRFSFIIASLLRFGVDIESFESNCVIRIWIFNLNDFEFWSDKQMIFSILTFFEFNLTFVNFLYRILNLILNFLLTRLKIVFERTTYEWMIVSNQHDFKLVRVSRCWSNKFIFISAILINNYD